MKKWKKIFSGLLVLAIALSVYGFYLYNKKPADVRKLSAKYEITATVLVAEFNANETAANAKYLDKVIAVKGNVADMKIDSAGQATIFLDSGDPLAFVSCSFYNDEVSSTQTLQKGVEVTIKGMCTGKLMDVVLNKCSIIK